jgi:hypothetical protein
MNTLPSTKTKPNNYEEDFLLVVKVPTNEMEDLVDPKTQVKLTRMFSPLGAVVYVYLGSYNHHVCEYAWSRHDGIEVGQGNDGRPELIGEWLALHGLWEEFIRLATSSLALREHISNLRPYSTLRSGVDVENVGDGDPELVKADALCRSISAQLACMEVLNKSPGCL